MGCVICKILCCFSSKGNQRLFDSNAGIDEHGSCDPQKREEVRDKTESTQWAANAFKKSESSIGGSDVWSQKTEEFLLDFDFKLMNTPNECQKRSAFKRKRCPSVECIKLRDQVHGDLLKNVYAHPDLLQYYPAPLLPRGSISNCVAEVARVDSGSYPFLHTRCTHPCFTFNERRAKSLESNNALVAADVIISTTTSSI